MSFARNLIGVRNAPRLDRGIITKGFIKYTVGRRHRSGGSGPDYGELERVLSRVRRATGWEEEAAVAGGGTAAERVPSSGRGPPGGGVAAAASVSRRVKEALGHLRLARITESGYNSEQFAEPGHDIYNTQATSQEGFGDYVELKKLEQKLLAAKDTFKKHSAVENLQLQLAKIQILANQGPETSKLNFLVECAQKRLEERTLTSELKSISDEAKRIMNEKTIPETLRENLRLTMEGFEGHEVVMELQRQVKNIEGMFEEQRLVMELLDELSEAQKRLHEHPSMIDVHRRIFEVQSALAYHPTYWELKIGREELRERLLKCEETGRLQRWLEEAREHLKGQPPVARLRAAVAEGQRRIEAAERREQSSEPIQGLPTKDMRERIRETMITMKKDETVRALQRMIEELEESIRDHPVWKESDKKLKGLERALEGMSLSRELYDLMDGAGDSGDLYPRELVRRMTGRPLPATLSASDSSEGGQEGARGNEPASVKLEKDVEQKQKEQLAAKEMRGKLDEVKESLIKHPGVQSIRKNAEKLLEEVARELGRRKWVEAKGKLDKVLGKIVSGKEKEIKDLEKTLNDAIASLKEMEKKGKSKVEELMDKVAKETVKLKVGQLALKVQEVYDKVTLPDDIRDELRKTLVSLEGPLRSRGGAAALEKPLENLLEALETRASHATISRRIIETNWAVKKYNEGE